MAIKTNGWPQPKEPKHKAPAIGHFICRLKIDKRTTVFVRSEESYKNWMDKFPKAERMDANV